MCWPLDGSQYKTLVQRRPECLCRGPLPAAQHALSLERAHSFVSAHVEQHGADRVHLRNYDETLLVTAGASRPGELPDD